MVTKNVLGLSIIILSYQWIERFGLNNLFSFSSELLVTHFILSIIVTLQLGNKSGNPDQA